MTRAVAKKKRAQARRDNTTLIIAGVIVAVVVVALLLLLNLNLNTQPSGPAVNAVGKTWGKADAPVTIDMWSDFQ
jgi:hypothetical protein